MAAAPVLFLLGLPGVGNGTQARMLEADFGLVQLSTGDLLRAAVARGTGAGHAARAMMAVVSPDVDDEVMVERVSGPLHLRRVRRGPSR